MAMDERPDDHRSRQRRPIGVVGWILRAPITTTGVRVIDSIVLFVGVVVAVVVCIPILILTLAAAYVIAQVLSALGVPDAIGGVVIIVLGVGGGLVIGFFVLLRVSRGLPGRVRDILYEADQPEPDPVSETALGRHDPEEDRATFIDRVAAADAAIAPRVAARPEDDRPDGG
jgi:hypothetical protein